MELAGDEKKIRALFSELSLAEAQAAPRFEKLWREASITQQAPRVSKPLVMIATASLLIAVAVLVAAWSFYKTPTTQNARTTAPSTTVENPLPRHTPEKESNQSALLPRRPHSHSTRRRTLAPRRKSDRAFEQQAAMLANWKSPTENFMTSPTRSGFDSLPQLNAAMKDLESFLQKKESNQ